MQLTDDVHQQFANYFPSKALRPYLYSLSQKLNEGHICLDVNQIDLKHLAEAGYQSVVDKKVIQSDSLISNGNNIAPFVLFNERLYMHRYFNYETIILNRIKDFVENEQQKKEQRLSTLMANDTFIKELFNENNEDYKNVTNWQMAAVITALSNNFTIITGGPGTGKTTTVAKILSILFTINPLLKVALTAPTGKAAARMKESLEGADTVSAEMKDKFKSLQPSTIHRLLGYVKNSPHFKANQGNPLNYDIIIADESSMIDVALFAKLLSAIGPDTRLILLGDKDQLASVEAGSLFGDLCQAQTQLNMMSPERVSLINSFTDEIGQKIKDNHIAHNTSHPLFEHIIELKFSRRFKDSEGIGKFSKAIINNKVAEINLFFSNTDKQVFIDTNYAEEIFKDFVLGYRAFTQEKDIRKALTLINNLRVLCAIREGEQGLYAINKKIEKHLEKEKIIDIDSDFYINRIIMVTSNNRELNLFNGDIGIIRADDNGISRAWFQAGEDEIKSVLPGFISNAETVFAMTIHKSQGSEFDKILVILPKGEEIKILTRELLYTAVTRAKNKVTIQGGQALILKTAEAIVQRGSGIIDRFKQ